MVATFKKITFFLYVIPESCAPETGCNHSCFCQTKIVSIEKGLNIFYPISKHMAEKTVKEQRGKMKMTNNFTQLSNFFKPQLILFVHFTFNC